MITIVDYGLGNIKAFANVYKKLGVPIVIAKRVDDFAGATKVILPGVGAFDYAMSRLEKSGMQAILDELVLDRKLPVLGVCVGLQMMTLSSEEGRLPGLGWIEADVKRFDPSSFTSPTCVPHMGWNEVSVVKMNPLLGEPGPLGRFYFLHSFFVQCRRSEDVIAVTDYGGAFTSAVNAGNIYGVQFHPEKSHQGGITLLQQFANLA